MSAKKRTKAQSSRKPDQQALNRPDESQMDLLDTGTISSMEMTGIAPAALPEDEAGAAAFNQLWTNPTRMLGAKPGSDETETATNHHKPKG